MENFTLKKDLSVFYVTADSFPKGIKQAMEKIHNKVADATERTTYGISRLNTKGIIEYKAGLEEKFEGEGQSVGCETMILRKGNYTSIVIKNYMQHIESISEAFQNILAQPGLDPQGYCVEIYENDKDVICMVHMAE